MTVMIKERVYKSQFGYSTGPSAAYAVGGNEINFAVGQIMFFRFATTIPKGSTINSATLTFKLNGKNVTAGQYSTHTVRAHASGDSPLLRPGVVEHNRPQTSAGVTWTPTWPTNPPADVLPTVDVKSIVEEVMGRSDFQSGNYITFMITCTNENGSDMNVQVNNVFSFSPRLTVDYTEPDTDTRLDFNRIENSEFNPTLNGLDETNAVPGWYQGEFYGTAAVPANQGTLAVDTTFTRVPGIPTLRFTAGPPPATDVKTTGPYCSFRTEAWEPTIFCGWIYVSTNIPTSTTVRAQEAFVGGGHVITTRGVWTPFCTNVITSGSGAGTRWWYVNMKPYVQGQQFWISEPTYMTSTFRQMPFNGLTPSVKDPGGVTLIGHRSTAGRQQSVREWLPRTAVKRNGALIRAPRYIKRSDGLLQVAEPIKGGPTVSNLPAVAIGSYPAGKTISEL